MGPSLPWLSPLLPTFVPCIVRPSFISMHFCSHWADWNHCQRCSFGETDIRVDYTAAESIRLRTTNIISIKLNLCSLFAVQVISVPIRIDTFKIVSEATDATSIVHTELPSWIVPQAGHGTFWHRWSHVLQVFKAPLHVHCCNHCHFEAVLPDSASGRSHQFMLCENPGWSSIGNVSCGALCQHHTINWRHFFWHLDVLSSRMDLCPCQGSLRLGMLLKSILCGNGTPLHWGLHGSIIPMHSQSSFALLPNNIEEQGHDAILSWRHVSWLPHPLILLSIWWQIWANAFWLLLRQLQRLLPNTPIADPANVPGRLLVI